MEAGNGRFHVAFDRSTPPERPLVFDEAATYTGDERRLTNTRNHEWLHPLGEVVGPVLKAGLRPDFLHEHDRIPWRAFAGMVEAGDGLFALPDGVPRFPLAFSLGATKIVQAGSEKRHTIFRKNLR